MAPKKKKVEEELDELEDLEDLEEEEPEEEDEDESDDDESDDEDEDEDSDEEDEAPKKKAKKKKTKVRDDGKIGTKELAEALGTSGRELRVMLRQKKVGKNENNRYEWDTVEEAIGEMGFKTIKAAQKGLADSRAKRLTELKDRVAKSKASKKKTSKKKAKVEEDEDDEDEDDE